MIAQRTAQTIATRAKRLDRLKRRDKVLQALHRIVKAKRAAGTFPIPGATVHEIQKALPELQHAQIGRELERACGQLAVEVVQFYSRGARRIRLWDLSKCKVCGCDELHACRGADGPCSWVSINLCSRCYP